MRHRPGEIEAEGAHEEGTDGSRQQHDAAAGEPGGEPRARRDGDGEHREQGRHHGLGTVEALAYEDGSSDRITAPTSQNQLTISEPRHRPGCRPRGRAAAPRRAGDVGIDAQGRRRLAGGGDRPGRQPAQHREGHDHRAEGEGAAPHGGGEPRHDGAEQDREEGRGLDERVAGGEFVPAQVIGQDAVLDRPEQARDRAEQAERHEQHRHRMHPEPRAAAAAAKISANFSRLAINALS